MTRRRARALSAWPAAAAVAALAALTPVAAALEAPGGVDSNRSTPSFAADATMSWNAVSPDFGGAITYQGGVTGDPGGTPGGELGGGTSTGIGLPGTPGFFRVRAVEQTLLGPAPGPYSAPYAVRRASISGSRSPGANPRGWANTPVAVTFTCTSGVPSCAGSRTFGQGVFPRVDGTGTDAGGLTGQASVSNVWVDLTPPGPGVPENPRSGEISASRRPVLDWTPGSDGLSGLQFYEVWLEAPTSLRIGATSPGTTRLTPSFDLPLGPIRWHVRTFDRAYSATIPGGPNNGSRSQAFSLVIDPSAPPAPAELIGPAGPTNDATPTFGWTGDGPRFEWVVTRPGQAPAVAQGATTERAVTVPALPDGPYAFRVKQIKTTGLASPQATRDFSVDTTVAPGGPTASFVGGAAPVVKRKPSGKLLPLTRNAKRLRPGPGAKVLRLRPILRWRPSSSAQIYNLQVFEIRGTRVKKVLSVFPNRSAYKVPADKLKWKRRYAWRVWPYLGDKGYSRTPIGISYFDVMRKKPGV